MSILVIESVDRLLATSIHTAILSAVVWGISHRKLGVPSSVQCWLWWLVSLQAVCGLLVGPILLPWLPDVSAATVSALDSFDTGNPAATATATAPPTFEAWKYVVFVVWLTGVLAISCVTFRDWQRGRALLRRASPCHDGAALGCLARISREKGLLKTPRLLVSSECSSPLLAGCFRPVLLLPAHLSLGSEDIEMAISHELAHLRRRDLLWGIVPNLSRHLFFFHPLVRLAVSEYDIAREAACDALVLVSGDRSRQAYGKLLVRLGTSGCSSIGVGVRSSAFHVLKRRLTLLQGTRTLSPLGSLAVIAVIAVGALPIRLVASQSSTAGTSPLYSEDFSPPGNPLATTEETVRRELFEAMLFAAMREPSYRPASSRSVSDDIYRETIARVRNLARSPQRLARIEQARERFAFQPIQPDSRSQAVLAVLVEIRAREESAARAVKP